MSYRAQLRHHYEKTWGPSCAELRWIKPRRNAKPLADFSVLVFEPSKRDAWTYATCGMSMGVELHLFSPREAITHAELLSAAAAFHREDEPLGLGHTINLGRPWLDRSACEYGLLSLPYLDGPAVEDFQFEGDAIKCLWLIPITAKERDFKKQHGLEALEQRMEQSRFDWLSPTRRSVV